MTTGMWILLILSIVFIIVGIGLLIYGLHKHEDKGEKTTTHKIMVGIGIALLLIGVGLLIFFIFKWRGNNKTNVTVLETSSDVPTVEMTDMSYRNQGFSSMNQGPMVSSYEQQSYGYQPGTPTFNPGMAYQQGPGPMGPNPMTNQWSY